MLKLLDKSAVEDLMDLCVEILETVGVKFQHDRALDLFRKAGASVEGVTVKIPHDLLERSLKLMPPAVYQPGERRVAAGAMFGNVPIVYDEEKKIFRQVTVDDAIKVYQLVETSDLYESSNPSAVDPIGLTGEDLYVTQIAFYLKYSKKYLANGLRSISKNAKNGNVYESARQGFRLVRDFYETYDEPVVDQTVCPMPPLGYDRESLDNLFATLDEEQNLGICPCSLTGLTGPSSLYELVAHDAAMALAGVVLAQLVRPGVSVGLSDSSGATNMRTMQPTYGSVEATLIQCMFFEFCTYYNISCSLCGTLCDSPVPDYAAGVETMLSTFLPYYYSDIDNIWCNPGDVSGWRCGSFEKAILDEETMRNINRAFRPLTASVEKNFMERLAQAKEQGNFLTGRTPREYRRDHYLSTIFSKHGVPQADSSKDADVSYVIHREIESRLQQYRLPERTPEQKKLLNKYLPTEYRY